MPRMSTRKQISLIALFLFAVVAGTFVTKAFADQDYLPAGSSANATRACSFAAQVAQVVNLTAVSAATTNAAGIGVVRIVCTQNAHFVQSAVGVAPTALTTSSFLPMLTPEYIFSTGGKFAFIRNSADGSCYVTDCK